eukprot:3313147-Rhodomonas_salina.3
MRGGGGEKERRRRREGEEEVGGEGRGDVGERERRRGTMAGVQADSTIRHISTGHRVASA